MAIAREPRWTFVWISRPGVHADMCAVRSCWLVPALQAIASILDYAEGGKALDGFTTHSTFSCCW